MSRRLIARVGRIKVYRDTDWNEYQCVDPDNANATNHTDDRDDAMATAAAMDRFVVGGAVVTPEPA